MARPKGSIEQFFLITLCMLFLFLSHTLAAAMPAQVMIIRHAEKFEDRQKISLNPRGKTRAAALSQFFQHDPRVLKHGVVSAIIAQRPNQKKKSVRCEETVEPLSKALGQEVINRFAYGEVKELVEWLKSTKEWDSKSALICAQHEDIIPLAKAFGVESISQSVWPHETYDRVWLLDFSPNEGKLISFQDIPQNLLFGDSFQSASGETQTGSVQFTQDYSQVSNGPSSDMGISPMWKSRITVQIAGDFSTFDDNTIPMLRVGGFTFGYYGTTLGKLKQNRDAEVEVDTVNGTGSLRYYYRIDVAGVKHTYAKVSFTWNKDWLKSEFEANVDENKIKPELNMPVECHFEKVDGSVNGVTNCYVAFGKQRFYAPFGLSYNGIASTLRESSNKEIYNVCLRDNNGVLIKKVYLPEL